MTEDSVSESEKWMEIPRWEGLYEASDKGNIRSLPRVTRGGFGGVRRIKGKILRPVKRPTGHVQVILSDGERREHHDIHRLVMVSFIGTPPPGMEVCHNNGEPSDNRLVNLRYGTRSENIYDAVKHGAHWQTKKTHCPRGHSLSGANVKKSGKGRECLACSRAHGYVRYHTERKDDLKIIADGYYSKIMER